MALRKQKKKKKNQIAILLTYIEVTHQVLNTNGEDNLANCQAMASSSPAHHDFSIGGRWRFRGPRTDRESTRLCCARTHVEGVKMAGLEKKPRYFNCHNSLEPTGLAHTNIHI